MDAATGPRRALIAGLATVVVLWLLVASVISLFRNENYGWGPLDSSKEYWNVDMRAAGFDERIRLALLKAPRETPQLTDKLENSNDTVAMGPSLLATDPWKQLALGLSVTVFALFGFVITWWGRDRVSLWLGIFGLTFAPPFFGFYGTMSLHGMLIAWIVQQVLLFVCIYALYAVAETFALEAVARRGRTRRTILVVRGVVIAAVVGAAVQRLVTVLFPMLAFQFAPDNLQNWSDLTLRFVWLVVFCAVPIGVLVLAYLGAEDEGKRAKVQIILLTMLAGLSGVFFSLVNEFSANEKAHFQTLWFTLLLIPLGFVFTISAYQVVEVKIVINRILVITTMTLIIGAILAGSETFAEMVIKPRLVNQFAGQASGEAVKRVIEFLAVFVIVMSFSSLHHWLDEAFKKIIFRSRDAAIEAMHVFAARRASELNARERLFEYAADLVHEAMGARCVAFYEEHVGEAGGYGQIQCSGTARWPDALDTDDPVVVALRSDEERIDLGRMFPASKTLGTEGLAFRMSAGGRFLGVFVVGPRERKGDEAYDPEEIAALDELVRAVSDAVFSLRARKTVAFVHDVAERKIAGDEAVMRAQQLVRLGLPDRDVPRAYGVVDAPVPPAAANRDTRSLHAVPPAPQA